MTQRWREPFDLNLVLLVGRVQEPPLVLQSLGGKAATRLLVRTRRVFEDSQGIRREEQANVACIAWGGLGEFLGRAVDAGCHVLLRGRLVGRPGGIEGWPGQDGQVVAISSFDMVGIEPEGGRT